MATSYPGALDSFTNPAGTSLVTSPDHALQHANANDSIVAVETAIGTTGGTNVLKNFVAGNFPARINSSGVFQQAVSGTFTPLNNSVIGTPAITGGTANNITLGTATVAGTIVLPSAVIPTTALVANAVTNGSMLFNAMCTAGTSTTVGFVNIGGLAGTFTSTGGVLLTTVAAGFLTPDERDVWIRFIGTSSAGTFLVPDATGFVSRPQAGKYTNVSFSAITTGVAAATYICNVQGSIQGGSLVTNASDSGMTASIIEFKK